MKHWKRLLALILCGCLTVGLSACGENDKPEEQTKEQTEEVGYASSQSEPSETENESSEEMESSDSFNDEEETDEQTDDSETDDEDIEDEGTESDDESADFEQDLPEETEEDEAVLEDGEAREEISQDDALQLVIDHFDTEDAGSGYAYAYKLVRADEIDGQSYYIFRQSWAEDEEDAEAGAKVLRYIFVATDGSVLYTGVVDGEQSVIDYDSEIIP